MNRHRITLTSKIYDKLRNDITFGAFKADQHLSEKFLAEKYKISRASIREVIGQLASQGHLTLRPQRGAIVRKLSLDDIDVAFNILIRCESYAALLFTKKGNGSVIKKLKVLNGKMEGKDIKLNYKVWLKMNDKFHKLIYSNCGNETLEELISNTRLRIIRFRMVKTDPEYIDLYNGQHDKIIAALEGRNGNLAERLMADHLEVARKHRLEIFKDLIELF